MTRKRYRPNWFLVSVLVVLIAIGFYVDRVVVPTIPPPFVPSATPTRSAESFLVEAKKNFDEGNLLQSISMYQEALRSNPQDDSIYVSMAQVQVFAGQYAEAQASAENAILLNSNNSMAHAVRAWALDFQGKYVDASDSIQRALTLDDKNGLAHAYYVEILVDAYQDGSGGFDDLAKAADESKVALSLAPNTIEANRARGYILEATQNYEEAIQFYTAAITINDKIPDLHLALGRNYRYLGLYDKAIEEFTRANSLNPGDPTPDWWISRTYATIGEFGKAAQFAQTAVNDAPTDPSLRGNYGVMLYSNGDWVETANQLGLAINGGKTPDGQTIEKITLTTEPRVLEYYYTYGLSLAHLNRCGEALQIAQQLLGRVPSNDGVVAKSNEIIQICQTNLSVTPTPGAETPAPGAGLPTLEAITPTPTAEPTSTTYP
jgi:tetratricopeptide (TPR) repeat protein